MGPATATISLDDGSFLNGVQTIIPGSRNNCSSTCVSQVTVFSFPRLQVSVSIGGLECNNPLMSAPTTAPLTSPNTCQQGFYDSVNFNSNGAGETVLGLLKTTQWGVVIFVLMNDILSDLNNEPSLATYSPASKVPWRSITLVSIPSTIMSSPEEVM